ncbi:VCBS domain-containing protein [Shewanella sp. JM162201]|uniref:VCBS domain-containing protein n=1 Tax=Shewanella jiangmenensis TaxID=2837387 RepID=A0ABS5V4R4_9GAMM|nr:VCBS domain-containing protein [Shewanella jiangmenensis]
MTDDKGAWADQVVTITITGTNDSPVITNDSVTSGTVVEAGDLDNGTDVAGTPSATGQLNATDVDADATESWSVLNATNAYGTFSVDGTGKWTFTLDNNAAATQALKEGQSQVLNFTVRVTDDKGAWADQVVTITITGTNDSPVITNDSVTSGTVVEAGDLDNGTDVAGTPSATGQLNATDVDADATESWSVLNATNAYGTFSVDGTGKWTFTLDNNAAATQALKEGQSQVLNFTVRVTDDKGAWADQVVTITITGTNDAPIISNQEFGYFENQIAGAVVANVVASDIDGSVTGFSFKWADNSYHAVSEDGYFSIDSSGKISMTAAGAAAAVNDFEQAPNSGVYVVTATDNNGGKSDANITLFEKDLDDTPPAAPTVWIVDDGTPGDGLLTQGEISSNGAGVQLQATVSHAELLLGGVVNLTVNNGGNISNYTFKLEGGSLVNTDGSPASGFSYNNGVISWNEDVPATGQSITVTATQTDVAGNTSAQASDTATVYQPGNKDITVNESGLRATPGSTVTVNSSVGFTAGNENLTQFRFAAIGNLNQPTTSNLAAGVTIVWALANGSIVGTIGGVEVVKMSLADTNAISANTSGNITVKVELLDNIKQVNGAANLNLSSLIEGVVVEAVGSNGSVISQNISVTIVDDLIEASATNSSGLNQANATITGAVAVAGADGNDKASGDEYAADLTVNIAGWNKDTPSTWFIDSGKTTGDGEKIYYFVDKANPDVLIAYTDSGTPLAAWAGLNGNNEVSPTQTLMFTLTVNPNDGSYVMNVVNPITTVTDLPVNFTTNIGGNNKVLYVDNNGQITKDVPATVAFTMTATANGVAATVNSSANGYGVGSGKDIDDGEVLSLNFTSPITGVDGLSFTSNSGATYTDEVAVVIHGIKGGIQTTVTLEGTSADLVAAINSAGFTSISQIDFKKVTGNPDFNLLGFTSSTEHVDPVGAVLNFNVAISDSDGDVDGTNPFTVTLTPPPSTLSALTPNALNSLSEATLLTDAPDSDSSTLLFKAGGSNVNSIGFASTDGIQVDGIRQPLQWTLSSDKQTLIGSIGNKELIKLTLDWDAITAGQQGAVEVKAELIGSLPHNANADSIQISGIKVTATDGSVTANSTVTVTVADDNNLANNDGGEVNVIVDSFLVSGVVANWTTTQGGSNIQKFDGTSATNGGGLDNDDGKDQLRWGVPSDTYKSGYGFIDNDAALSGHLALNEDIVLGTFTHYNWPTQAGTSITGASMNVTFTLTDAYGKTTPVSLDLNFTHNETPNDEDDPEASKDIVKVGQTSVTFNYEGAFYTLQVVGFKDKLTGNVVTEIHTAENKENSYELVVRMVAGTGYELPSTSGNVLHNDVAGSDKVMNIVGIDAGDKQNTGVSGNVGTKVVGQYGVLTLLGDGNYNYQVTANGSKIPAGAVDTFTYTITDADGDKSSALINIAVNKVENLPVATNADSISGLEDRGPIEGNVLSNDSVNNTSVTSFSIAGSSTSYNAGNTAHTLADGVLTLKANGDYSFQPNSHWSGKVPEITYTTNTGSVGTLSITVEAVADAPTLKVGSYTNLASINFEDVPVSGGWSGVKADSISGLDTLGTWHTSNSGGKIEVGLEKTYLGGDSNNKVMEIEFNNGDKTLYTDMRLEAGRFYELGFDIAARVNSASTSGLTIKLIPLDAGGNPIMAQAVMLYDFNPTSSGWLKDQKVTLPVGTSGNYRLLFEADNSDSVGAIMDNLAFRAVDNLGYHNKFIKLGNISSSLVDKDGSESLSVKLQGLPEGAILKDGLGNTAVVGADGTLDISSWDKSNLQIKAPNTGTFNVTVVATATEASNLDKAQTNGSFQVTVLPPATISNGAQGNDTFLLTESGNQAQFAVDLGAYFSGITPVGSVDLGVQYFAKSTELLINAGASNDYVDLGVSTANNVVNTGSSLPNLHNAVVTQAEIMASKFMTEANITDGDGTLLNDVLQQMQPKTDTVNLGSGNDTVNGGEGNQVVYGGGGNDLLIGGEGIDGLRGGSGDDTLIGGLGDDVLRGDGGNDVLRGDGGSDIFVWKAGETGTDHIIDFNVNEDKLDLSDLLQGEENGNLEDFLSFSFGNSSTTIEIDANKDGVIDQRIVLDGVDLRDAYNLQGQDADGVQSGIINGLLGNGTGPLIVDTQSDSGDAQPIMRSAPQPLDEDRRDTILP